ncbi:uncharacterized protein LOC136024867 [Artemia franciscana]|uniref:uncharacterized protein LOC136024867 n=1 Tax=Artemia franciscana TaxID=6661 RepID=UPI0032D9BC63
MAELITTSEGTFIKKEIDDALPVESGKPFHISNQFLSPKREDIPIIPSISGPCKFEYEIQESGPTCSENEDIEDIEAIEGIIARLLLADLDCMSNRKLAFLLLKK